MPIYLDHAATTPVRPEVLEAMLPLLQGTFGNPSSAHVFGRAAREALDDAHERLAHAIGADAREIVFTSGGTEATNLALKGAAWAGKPRGHRLVTTAVEHHATEHALRYLEKFGFEVVEVGVDRYGRVDPDEFDAALNDRTTVVSVILGNNEVGTLQPVAEIAARVRARRGILLHVDAVQAAPWVDLDVEALGADLVSLAGHKDRGPKGVGALWTGRTSSRSSTAAGRSGAPPGRDRVSRRGRRHGPGVRASGGGARRAPSPHSSAARPARRGDQRHRSRRGHRERPAERLPHIASFIAKGIEARPSPRRSTSEGIAISTGSACATGSAEVSTSAAMGYPADEARRPAAPLARPHHRCRGGRGRPRDGGRAAPPRARHGLAARWVPSAAS
ncbi:MAG: cysteine desulfurase family protein [Chloroflexota bacterium]